ncbi:MAG: hypothetical protein M3004_04870 [Bacteroidota bacterium]|nr:hypothetical protein [Bacteroidota bacterium]
MTKKETINRNIGLTFDFVREIIKNPSLAESLPPNCEVEFIEKDFSIKDESSLNKKHIIKVKNTFESISKVAEPHAKYGKDIKQ